MSPPVNFSLRYAPLSVVLISTAVAICAYLQLLGAPFISDDSIYIVNNKKLAGLQLAELWRLMFEPYNSMEFLPLRDLTYWLDSSLFGLNPSAFRIHNILWYLLCCAMVFAVTLTLWRNFRPADAAGAAWPAAVVTALFAIHPAHVEAVVWVSGRKDVLAGVLSMAALWFAVAKPQPGFSPQYAVAAMIALLAAMLCKATAVVVAPLIALLWVISWRETPIPLRHRSTLLFALAIVLLAASLAVVFTANSAVRAPAYWGIETVTRALAVVGWMARLAATPEGRHYFYPVFEDPQFYLMVTLGALIVLAGAAGMVMLWKKRTLEGLALCAFLLMCLPYTQLVPYQTFSLVSDRFVFLAVWPAIVLAVARVWRFKPVPRTVILLIIALPWTYQTIVRPPDWRGVEALADADLRAYPGHYIPASYKINQIQLPLGQYRQASVTARAINDPLVRDLVNKLIQSDYAVYAHAWTTGQTAEAISGLWELDAMYRKPPDQIKWNPSIAFLWESIRIRLHIRWTYLARNFPDDSAVRYNADLWLSNDQNSRVR
jgi:hypothetical protein